MTQPTACVAVFERRPHWGPELQRQLATQNILVQECRSLSDVESTLASFSSRTVLLDLDAAPADCLMWLRERPRSLFTAPVVVCASRDLSDLEWLMRDAGAIAFVNDEVSGRDLARLCLRQLRLT